MIVATHLENLPLRRFPKIVLTLGVFDGMHKGHQKIVRHLLTEAHRIRGTSVILTFQNHPNTILRPEERTLLLTSLRHKLSLINRWGIDLCIALPFDRELSCLSPEEFVRRLLVQKLRVEKVILGEDARFGRNREGDVQVMESLAKNYGFRFGVVHQVRYLSYVVSSTLIRRLISEGHLSLAQNLMGRNFSMLGTVIRGCGRGKTLGFPTANLVPHSDVLPPRGVYMVRVRFLRGDSFEEPRKFGPFRDAVVGPAYSAVMNLGSRPTFGSSRTSGEIPEVHIIDFAKNIYNQTIEVEFLRRLRDETKFGSLEDLKVRIEEDVKVTKAFLSKGRKSGAA